MWTSAMVAAVFCLNKGMDFCVISLTTDFPAIDPMFLKQILKNKFDPINISKLQMYVILVRPTIKSIEPKKSIVINTGKDNNRLNDI